MKTIHFMKVPIEIFQNELEQGKLKPGANSFLENL